MATFWRVDKIIENVLMKQETSSWQMMRACRLLRQIRNEGGVDRDAKIIFRILPDAGINCIFADIK